MITATLALSLSLFLGTPLAAPPDVSNDWIDEYDQGVELARKEGKDLLVDFTGSDWCKWCKKLDVEVFRSPAFLEAAKEQYVLVKVDLPRRKPALERVPDIARNREVAQELGVTNFPTILLMTADGDVWGRTGYREGGAAPYVEHLQKLRQRGRVPLMKAIEIAAAFARAGGPARLAECERAVELLAALKRQNPGGAKLVPAVSHAMEADSEGESGLLTRALKALYVSGLSTIEHVNRGKVIDPKNEAGLFELAVYGELFTVKTEREARGACDSIDQLDALGPIRDKEAAWLIYSNAAIWQDRLVRDQEAAKKYASKALATGGGNAQVRARMKRLASH